MSGLPGFFGFFGVALWAFSNLHVRRSSKSEGRVAKTSITALRLCLQM